MSVAAAHIRIASADDSAAIASIYAPYVESTVISFEVAAPTVEEMRARISTTLERYPWLVSEHDGRVVGYAYASTHRVRAAYQWSVDTAVYIDPAFHGRGIGRELYAALFSLLTRQGFVNAYAGITLPNEKSVGLHEAVGFRPVGVYRHVGFKFGRWHDVGWWALELQRPTVDPAPPAPLTAIAR